MQNQPTTEPDAMGFRDEDHPHYYKLHHAACTVARADANDESLTVLQQEEGMENADHLPRIFTHVNECARCQRLFHRDYDSALSLYKEERDTQRPIHDELIVISPSVAG